MRELAVRNNRKAMGEDDDDDDYVIEIYCDIITVRLQAASTVERSLFDGEIKFCCLS